MSGWIKLHRQIRNHWVFKNANYFKAWVVIISEVNHKSTKVVIEGELIECKRGQSINSLATWVKILGDDWTIQKLRTFLKLLEKDEMINTEGLRKTTRLTVCNYESYQSEQQGDNKQTTNRQQADNKEITTNKNEKNEKNEKEIDFSPFGDDFKIHWITWLAYKKSQFRFTYKQIKTEQMAFNDLVKKSNTNKLNAIAIINNSMVNGWKGLMPLKEDFQEPKSFTKLTENMNSIPKDPYELFTT